MPSSDYASGRYREGYRCNTQPVARQGETAASRSSGTSTGGPRCAFYDSTLLFPKDVLMKAAKGLGVVVLDMKTRRNR